MNNDMLSDQATIDSDAGDDSAIEESVIDASFDLTAAPEVAAEAEVADVPEDDPWTKPGSWYVVHSQ